MGAGQWFLVAIIDWASRRVLAYRLSNTLDWHFGEEVLEVALSIMILRYHYQHGSRGPVYPIGFYQRFEISLGVHLDGGYKDGGLTTWLCNGHGTGEMPRSLPRSHFLPTGICNIARRVLLFLPHGTPASGSGSTDFRGAVF